MKLASQQRTTGGYDRKQACMKRRSISMVTLHRSDRDKPALERKDWPVQLSLNLMFTGRNEIHTGLNEIHTGLNTIHTRPNTIHRTKCNAPIHACCFSNVCIVFSTYVLSFQYVYCLFNMCIVFSICALLFLYCLFNMCIVISICVLSFQYVHCLFNTCIVFKNVYCI